MSDRIYVVYNGVANFNVNQAIPLAVTASYTDALERACAFSDWVIYSYSRTAMSSRMEMSDLRWKLIKAQDEGAKNNE